MRTFASFFLFVCVYNVLIYTEWHAVRENQGLLHIYDTRDQGRLINSLSNRRRYIFFVFFSSFFFFLASIFCVHFYNFFFFCSFCFIVLTEKKKNVLSSYLPVT